MNLKAYFAPLLKYWWLIVAAALIAAVSSFFVTLRQPLTYQTQTTLVVGRTMYEANPSGNDMWLGQQLASYYADIGTRGDVRSATQEALGLSRLPSYAINPLPNSQLLEIVVVDTNPERAQAVANELANQLIRRSPTSNEVIGTERQEFINEQIVYLEGKIRETLDEITRSEKALTEMNSARQISDTQAEISALQEKLSQLQSNYASLISNTGQGAINTLSVIERAPVPRTPIGPNKVLIIALASLVAAAIATAAAYLLEFLDDTITTPEEVSSLMGSVPLLGNIPLMSAENEAHDAKSSTRLRGIGRRFSRILPSLRRNKTAKDKTAEEVYLYASTHARSWETEEFRSLRVNLDFVGVDKPLKTLLVASPEAGEGKTSIATNLAIVMAQAGKKVILLDADFRKPSVDQHFRIANKVGLSDIFRDNMDLNDVVQRWKEDNLWIVTTGNLPPNPVDLLSSNKMNTILAEMTKISDVVIIDGPPLIFPDSLALATKVDGVLMVVRHSYTRKGHVQARYKQLMNIGARIIGVVMNKVPARRAHPYSGYYQYQQYRAEGEKKPELKRVN